MLANARAATQPRALRVSRGSLSDALASIQQEQRRCDHIFVGGALWCRGCGGRAVVRQSGFGEAACCASANPGHAVDHETHKEPLSRCPVRTATVVSTASLSGSPGACGEHQERARSSAALRVAVAEPPARVLASPSRRALPCQRHRCAGSLWRPAPTATPAQPQPQPSHLSSPTEPAQPQQLSQQPAATHPPCGGRRSALAPSPPY